MENKILYNGTVKTLNGGQSATLACKGKKPVTNIAIVFGSAGTIVYNGTETAVEAGNTATMECAEKRMLTDVVVSVLPT